MKSPGCEGGREREREEEREREGEATHVYQLELIRGLYQLELMGGATRTTDYTGYIIES